jgi:predicted transcriptional regulator
MSKREASQLSRRERQIMDVLYRMGRAGVTEVQESLPDPPSYSAVRALLRILEEKDHVRHEEKDGRYIYVPKVSRDTAKRSALRQMVDTFFAGSPAEAVAALLDQSAAKLTDKDFDRLQELVEKARKEGR